MPADIAIISKKHLQQSFYGETVIQQSLTTWRKSSFYGGLKSTDLFLLQKNSPASNHFMLKQSCQQSILWKNGHVTYKCRNGHVSITLWRNGQVNCHFMEKWSGQLSLYGKKTGPISLHFMKKRSCCHFMKKRSCQLSLYREMVMSNVNL